MPADWLGPLLRDEARRVLREEAGGVLTTLGAEAQGAGRFEGLYGGVYDRAIRTDATRRLAPLVLGDARPITDLDAIVAAVAKGTQPARPGTPPVLLDVPAGGGTLLPRLAAAGLRGRVVAADLGRAMLARAGRLREREDLPLDVALLRADAQDLPLRDAAADAAVSLNGLHVLPDPRAFLAELGRVVRPRGRMWLVTLISGGSRRADAVIGAGRVAGILPGPPPTRPTLLRWLADAGFATVAPLGGSGLLGVEATRR